MRKRERRNEIQCNAAHARFESWGAAAPGVESWRRMGGRMGWKDDRKEDEEGRGIKEGMKGTRGERKEGGTNK